MWCGSISSSSVTLTARKCQIAILISITSAISLQLEQGGIAVTDLPRKHLLRSSTDAVIVGRKIELSQTSSSVVCSSID